MAKLIFKNNAQSTLAGSISGTATQAQLAAGTGILFASPQAGEYFVATMIDAATGLINEIVWVTQLLGDTITMVRGQENTTPKPWNANDAIAELWTAGQAKQMLQAGENQSQASNYGLDTGTPNAVRVTLDPPLTGPVPGMPIRVLIANNNTGASTLDAGHGAANIVNGQNQALAPLELIAGLVAEFVWVGTKYEKLAPATPGATVPPGTITDYAGGAAPGGWLFCYGQSLLRTQYPDLFAAIDVQFGTVDSTHFTLPDCRGRFTAAPDGGTGRLTAPQVNTPTLGGVGGTQSEAAGVSGSCSVGVSGSISGGASGTIYGYVNSCSLNGITTSGGSQAAQLNDQVVVNSGTLGVGGSFSGSGSGSISGATAAVTNVPPVIIFHKIIKT